ncbi:hypothetical protein LWH48_12010 [Halomonas sp. G15]|uniref:hypothetical protein n=1 Tax=Halomonas sp. G15 TaxID=2903521 RepID=UPI001E3E915F|nr:hypothetical protein [Halomonas sp. G15]MCE0733502.1 hypothetical protein [Halomonas sp. G15]
MTINVALSTSEAIVLGCDSLSSVTQPVVHSHPDNIAYKDGEMLLDDEGAPCFTAKAITHNVVNVFGGVRKMFCIYESGDFHVAGVTAGLAILEGMTIAEHANKFRRENRHSQELQSVDAVAAVFLEYIREKWEITVGYKPSDEHDQFSAPYPPLEFLVAGFEPSGEGRVYRLDVSNDSMALQHDGSEGIAWAGQANYVQRLIMGFDATLGASLIQEGGVSEDYLARLRRQVGTNIDFANLPTQYAIDFVEMLVNTQSGMQRFEPGIATVGGRTHIGVLRRGERFTMLNEPELVHKHTGFNHDD